MFKYGPANILECQKLAETLARAAGVIIKEHFGRTIGIEFKYGEKVDPVTEVDFKCQEFISAEIKKYYPDHAFIGEETDKTNNKSSKESKYVWVVDPLDGTLNFSSNFPLFSSSIALLYDGEPIVGAIHLPWPYTKDGIVVHSSVGNGVFCDDLELKNFLADRVEQSSLGVFPNRKISDYGLDNVKSIENRNTGSIAVDLALVGMNVLRYAVASAPRIWDVAAGIIIVKESGGTVKKLLKPNKITNFFQGNRLKLENFNKFEWDTINKESNLQLLNDWRETLIFGDFE